MKEYSTQTLETMQSAVSSQTEQSLKPDFYYKRELPDNLKALETIAWNYFWSWEKQGAEIFCELEPSLWEKCEQNPRLFLKKIKQFRLWQKSTDLNYVEKVNKLAEKLENYLSQEPQNSGRVSLENPVAYFCAEYGVHQSLPNYSGGLGILAGDHLKSASDLNIPLVAVGLLYRYGYFRQKIAHDS